MDPILEYALENRNYFSWPHDIKIEACHRLAAWITNRSFSGTLTRQQLIDKQIKEAEEAAEYEYCAFLKDVEKFFINKNWDHLQKEPISVDN